MFARSVVDKDGGLIDFPCLTRHEGRTGSKNPALPKRRFIGSTRLPKHNTTGNKENYSESAQPPPPVGLPTQPTGPQ